ncbi:hypothetical protein [Leptolyngbya sp. FACHB-8]|uniref:hypothetical protein n=1 Tax=unclassified Leptolyngbya TaxID=2650499 RepID=UPI001687DA27|nr:hypothetical protein [Leptolyngbya sp. FACHB-8]MBD1911287.1 hypothetical protein [Leptolyngbya sp. FACHB-8]
MRLSITKPQHRQLLLEIAAQLRSDDPKDALEHVLNCWISPYHSQPVVVPPATPADVEAVAIAPSPDSDLDIEALASWD